MKTPDEAECPLKRLNAIVARLRGPDGCPWDRKQTHQSLKPLLREECAELLDAIDANDIGNMREEAGDLLLHIVLLARIAEENGDFSLNDVAEEICGKMIRRHPHVFGDAKAESPEEVVGLWEKIKAGEKAGRPRRSLLAGVPRSLPALVRAESVQKKAAKVGFDWNHESQIVVKIEEELEELKEALAMDGDDEVEEEIGDLLFAVVNLARFRGGAGVEDIMTESVRKFQKRFLYIEERLSAAGIDIEKADIIEMERLWNEAKSSV